MLIQQKPCKRVIIANVISATIINVGAFQIPQHRQAVADKHSGYDYNLSQKLKKDIYREHVNTVKPGKFSHI